jgi:hypothetical protein
MFGSEKSGVSVQTFHSMCNNQRAGGVYEFWPFNPTLYNMWITYSCNPSNPLERSAYNPIDKERYIMSCLAFGCPPK